MSIPIELKQHLKILAEANHNSLSNEISIRLYNSLMEEYRKHEGTKNFIHAVMDEGCKP
jgi:hypothetical protein